ncbi:MAG: hypothetical protein AAGB12_04490 [Pseudomonadota bacterium]
MLLKIFASGNSNKDADIIEVVFDENQNTPIKDCCDYLLLSFNLQGNSVWANRPISETNISAPFSVIKNNADSDSDC